MRVLQRLTAWLLCASATALAEPPVGYYDLVDDSSAEALAASLHDIIDDHLFFRYTDDATDTRDIINAADQDPLNPGNILDIYKNASYPKISGGTGAYNREHSWPKSYGFPDYYVGNSPYTDVHHLFASDSVTTVLVAICRIGTVTLTASKRKPLKPMVGAEAPAFIPGIQTGDEGQWVKRPGKPGEAGKGTSQGRCFTWLSAMRRLS